MSHSLLLDTEVVYSVDAVAVEVFHTFASFRLDESLDDGTADVEMLVATVCGLRVDDFTTVAVDVGGQHHAALAEDSSVVADLVARMCLDCLPFLADVLADDHIHNLGRLVKDLGDTADVLHVVLATRHCAVVFGQHFDAGDDFIRDVDKIVHIVYLYRK